MPTSGGRIRLGIARAAANGQPRNGASHENRRVGESSDLAVMKVINGPTPTPWLKSEAAIGNTTYGPPGITSPISQPIKIPCQPDCSPIHLTSSSRETRTSKKPARQNPSNSGSQTSCNNAKVV